MKRGDFFRVKHPSSRDTKRSRVFAIVSRQALVESKFSTVVCAPIYSQRHGLATQVDVGTDEGLKHDSAIHCDELVSIPKTSLTNWISSLRQEQLAKLDRALRISLDLS